MATKNPITERAVPFLTKLLSIMDAKNADYAAPELTGNPFHNFDVVALMHGSTSQIVLSEEIAKKSIRIANLVRAGLAQVPNESLTDSLRDLIGYALILNALLEHEAEQASLAADTNEQLTLNLDPQELQEQPLEGGMVRDALKKLGLIRS